MKVLILTEDAADDTRVVSYLRKNEIPYISVPLQFFVVETAGVGQYSLCLFVLQKGKEAHLQVLRSVKENIGLTGDLGPPVVFLVEENSAAFEREARIAEIDIFLTRPIDEQTLESLLKLRPKSICVQGASQSKSDDEYS